MQNTLIIIKADTIQRWLVWEVISRIERKGLRISNMKMMELSSEILKDHYSHLADKPFFPEIEEYMTRTPLVFMIVSGKESIATMRSLCGATNPVEALPGTIRWDLGLTINGNIIHASDSEETAREEIVRFFGSDAVLDYSRADQEIL